MWTLLWIACATEAPPTEGPATGAPVPSTPEATAAQSGAALQDPTGFPRFHGHPAPAGPAPDPAGAWSDPVRLSDEEGGLRPQIAAAPDGALHVVYYSQTAAGDLLRHRARPVGCDGDCGWTAAEPLGHDSGRSWGPDLVVDAQGAPIVSYDHSAADFRGAVYWTRREADGWTAPAAVSAPGEVEVGSAHLAETTAGLAFAWIERALQPGARFAARARWLGPDGWGEIADLQGPLAGAEAWHTNVERRPDGSALAGWDLGPGGGENTVVAAVGRDGHFSPGADLSAGRFWGERPHFAFDPDGGAHVVWFHRTGDRPVRVWYRAPDGSTADLSRGVGGFHFDPDVERAPDGTICAVWGWDAGSEAELVYALRHPGEKWTRPARVATLGAHKPGLPSLSVTADGTFHVVWAQWIRGEAAVWTAHLDPASRP